MNGISGATIRTMESFNVLDEWVVGARASGPGPNAVWPPGDDNEKVLGILGVFLAPEGAEWDRKHERCSDGGIR